MAEVWLNNIKSLGLIALLILVGGCTREINKSSTISLRLPGGASSFQTNSLSQSAKDFTAMSGGSTISTWGLTDPDNINLIGCYVILIEGPSPGGTINSCVTTGGTVVAQPWLSAGAYVAGSTIEISVPPGSGRKINLVGFKANSAANCTDFFSGNGPSRINLSAPIIIGSKTVDLSPNGRSEITINASLSGAIKFNDCGNWIHSAVVPASVLVLDTATNESTSIAYIPVSLTSAAAVDIGFELNVTNAGTATYLSDYVTSVFNGVISAGALVTYIPVPIVNDSSYEGTETMFVSITPDDSATSVSDPVGIISILDDETAPSIFIYSTSTIEGNSAVLTVSLSQTSGANVVFNYASMPGTATVGSDYMSGAGTVTLLPGTLTYELYFNTIDDASIESDELFSVTLTSLAGAIAGSTGTSVTILDNDSGLPFLYVSDVTVGEGSSSSILVSIDQTSASPVSFNLVAQTTLGTAAYGPDYTFLSGTGTIAAGSLTIAIEVPNIDDALFEDNETIVLSLSGNVGASIAGAIGVVTIVDNDSAPYFFVGSPSVTEGAAANIVVSLSGPSGKNVMFNYSTLDNTGLAGLDYMSETNSGVISAGSLTTLIPVTTYDDLIFEGTEVFQVTVTSITNAMESSAFSVVTLMDDESPPNVYIYDSTSSEPGSLNFIVSLSGSSATEITVDYATANGTAVGGNDFAATSGTLTFAAGITTQDLDVTVFDDILEENSESMSVTLSNPLGAAIIDSSGLGTINANDANSIFITDATANESAGTLAIAVYTNTVPMNDVTFYYATTSQSAISAVDYSDNFGFFTILGGTTIGSINIALIDDTIHEPAQTFLVSLSSLTNTTAGDLEAQGTILDNDIAPQLFISSGGFLESGIANITISLDAPTESVVTFNYFTSNSTALSGVDYTAASGSITMAPGSLSVVATVGLIDDHLVEADKIFFFDIASPTVASIGLGTMPIDILDDDGWKQESFLKAANAETGDNFGKDVALFSNFAIVSAPFESSSSTSVINGTGASVDNSAAASGAAYVYERTPPTWSEVAYLKASNAEANDQFGTSTAVFNDLVAIGSTYEASNQTTISLGTLASLNNSASQAGAVYIYKRTGATWHQEAYIKASNASASDQFGYALALDGNTLVVSTPAEDSNLSGVTNGTASSANNATTNAGAAYVYVRDSGGTWTQQAFLKAADPLASDSFGIASAIHGDTIAIGASGEDANVTGVINGTGGSANAAASGAGAAYIFQRTGGSWVQQAYVKAANTGSGDQFGESISIHGDTLLIGASSEGSDQTTVTMGTGATADNSASYAGAAYVYKRTANTWVAQAFLKPSNNKTSQYFGSSVSLWGDMAVVGAPNEPSATTQIINGGSAANDNSTPSGAAYVFRRMGGTWKQESYIKAPNASSGDYFGVRLSVNGDTLLVSASAEDSMSPNIVNGTGAPSDNSSSDSGASYVFTSAGPLAIVLRQDPAQADPAGAMFPIKFLVEFSRPINPATFTTGDITQNGTATGVTWNITNSGDNRLFTLTATAGSAGTYIPSVSQGLVQDVSGTPVDASMPGYDSSVDY